MLLWINGPFGGGKSETARELHSRLPGQPDLRSRGAAGIRSAPDAAGRSSGATSRTSRPGGRACSRRWTWSSGRPAGTVIAPMTLIEPGVFRRDHRAADRRRRMTSGTSHCWLTRRVIERRLRERAIVHAIQRLRGQAGAAVPRAPSRCRKLDLCLSRLSQREFATQLRTDHLTVPQVAEAIAASSGLELGRHRGSAVSNRIRLASRGLRHALTRAI